LRKQVEEKLRMGLRTNDIMREQGSSGDIHDSHHFLKRKNVREWLSQMRKELHPTNDVT